MRRVYLDHNATTPVHPEVLEAMMPFFRDQFGNASSIHWAGREVKKYLDEARDKVSALMNADPEEVIFTGCEFMKDLGYEITYLSVDRDGLIDLEELRRSIRPDTILVSIMFANNETGTIMPVQEIGALCREKGVLFHTDAVQAVGKIPIDLKKLPVDILSLSGHKPYIIGLGKACEIARRDFAKRHEYLQGLRDRLQEGIFRKVPHVELNGHPTRRLPNTLNVSFLYVEGESLLLNMDLEGIAVSSGSACSSGSADASHVILAMGKSPLVAQSAIRLSLGWTNTGEDVDYVLEVVPPILERLRAISPLYQKASRSKT
jgi:cysteine desulfurase